MNRHLKYWLSAAMTGVLSIGIAWAGAGLTPVKVPTTDSATKTTPATTTKGAAGQVVAEQSAAEFVAQAVGEGQLLAGAAKVSLYPKPENYQTDFPGARWEQDYAKCQTLPPPEEDPGYPEKLVRGTLEGATHVPDFRVRWHENSNCLYMGGYGIGPMFPITKWDEEYGLWARSVAMSDGQDAVVLTLIDAVYWEAHYNSLCPKEPCGFIDIANQLAEKTGLPANSFIFASTHSHTAPDFIGGWGGVPKWYMQQATESLKAAVTEALRTMQPAVLETGETILRERNRERRRHYRSAEDDGLSWFRLIDADNQPAPSTCTTPPPDGNNGDGGGKGFGNQGKDPVEPVCTEPNPGRAIATVGAYAAHPVTADEESGMGDADFPAVFAKRVEESFGGVGMFLQTGLGNMSPRGNKVEMGNGLAAAIPPIGGGKAEADPNVRVGRTFWNQPVTNVPLGTLGVAGFFDRTFNQTPAAVNEGKSEYPHKRCSSASQVSVRTSVSVAKVGGLLITGGPGELFANLTNTIEEQNPGGVTMALGLVNDGLGYIVQEFETDHVARQGVGFANGPLSEYEDAYSIDHCFGDATLEHTLRLIGTL